MNDPWKSSSSPWVTPLKSLNDSVRRKMFAVLVSEEVKYVMQNHLFRFGETHYRQSEGGSIGSILTGEV